MFEPPKRLTCFEVRDRVTQNSMTHPLRVVARDDAGNAYPIILKVREPLAARGHFGGTSLVCELACAMIARAIGLQVPDYAIVTVPPALLWKPMFKDPVIFQTLDNNKGENFGSVELTGVSEVYPPGRLEDDVRAGLENVVAFDSAVLNGDRTVGKPNTLWKGTKEFFLIDHSLALVAILSSPGAEKARGNMLTDAMVRDHSAFTAIRGEGRSFDVLFAQWRARVTAKDVKALLAEVPSSWDRRGDEVARIATLLSARDQDLDDIRGQLRRVAK